MTQMTAWRATATFPSTATEITDEVADALMLGVPGFGIARFDGTRLELAVTVEARTVRQAADMALKAAQLQYHAAFGVAGIPVALRLLSEDDFQAELADPPEMDLVGIAEIAELGSKPDQPMLRQQAQKLTRRPDFPAPVATLKATPVFTRKSVELFFQRWPRVGGWAGKHAAEAARSSA